MPAMPVPDLDKRLEALVRSVVLADEDAAAFCHSLLDYLRRFQPAEAVEPGLVEEMVAATRKRFLPLHRPTRPRYPARPRGPAAPRSSEISKRTPPRIIAND